MSWGWQKRGIFVALKERLHQLMPLGPEHRTRAIEQTPTHRQQGPIGLQKLRLQARQLPHIGLAPQPAHIGVTAHDARGRTRRIQQNRVKLLPRLRGLLGKAQGILTCTSALRCSPATCRRCRFS